MHDAQQMTRQAADLCGAQPEQALVMSTGIIGRFLSMEKITEGFASALPKLGNNQASFEAAARGILTTDKSMKVASRTVELSTGPVLISGMCKGAGMIGPKMATMLGVIMTDAHLDKETAQQMLTAAAEESFNCVSVEGHMSTNDTLLLLASGTASDTTISGDDATRFQAALTDMCIELAKMLPDDGEGSTHLIEIEVAGCATVADARRIAETIASSALVKTAITGCDPNWGRIVSAAGYAGVKFDSDKVDLLLNGLIIYEQGAPATFDAAQVSGTMRTSRNVHLHLQLGEGDASARHWTSDLTVEYVKFNADYTT
jgi:glutamate N-acetyltransferase/amino-acid N-acetyltransferase